MSQRAGKSFTITLTVWFNGFHVSGTQIMCITTWGICAVACINSHCIASIPLKGREALPRRLLNSFLVRYEVKVTSLTHLCALNSESGWSSHIKRDKTLAGMSSTLGLLKPPLTSLSDCFFFFYKTH